MSRDEKKDNVVSLMDKKKLSPEEESRKEYLNAAADFLGRVAERIRKDEYPKLGSLALLIEDEPGQPALPMSFTPNGNLDIVHLIGLLELTKLAMSGGGAPAYD